ncbi:putative 7,8-dihydro-8-oxoguanine triphosphatase [Paratrimastix pyriformis]|uniref:Oxidized purine nucleoside triphosphate hydrolase n=1 Tax=Paratrimastix pyriformis TaxID=342808 RepID=A0ABQ8USN7_9EUKA|nr:putative 7,8-dihydro-8-oxoguanine triphosphatase [Paratrimastix pyriformis]
MLKRPDSVQLATLFWILEPNRVLLGMKKRGFGVGKYNGFGGKVQADETPLQGALRELQEECGLIPIDTRPRGILLFEFVEPDKRWYLEVHLYSATKFTGNVTESEEMRPEWFAYPDVPHGKMWEDDKYWWPILMRDSNFLGHFVFDNSQLLSRGLVRECPSIPARFPRPRSTWPQGIPPTDADVDHPFPDPPLERVVRCESITPGVPTETHPIP